MSLDLQKKMREANPCLLIALCFILVAVNQVFTKKCLQQYKNYSLKIAHFTPASYYYAVLTIINMMFYINCLNKAFVLGLVLAALFPTVLEAAASLPLNDTLKASQVPNKSIVENVTESREEVFSRIEVAIRLPINDSLQRSPTDPPSGIPTCPEVDTVIAIESSKGLKINWQADADSLLVGTTLSFYTVDENLIKIDTVWGQFTYSVGPEIPEEFRVEVGILCEFKGEFYDGNLYSFSYQRISARPSNICYNNGDCADPNGNPHTPFQRDLNYQYQAGDIISYATFALRIAEITRVDSIELPSEGGVFKYLGYWGTGEVALPFDKRVIEVTFDSLGFSYPANGYASYGTVHPIYSTGGAFQLPPTSAPDTAFCIAEPVIDTSSVGYWNSDGIWMPDSTAYDNNGFNIDGTYIKTVCDTSTSLCNSAYDPHGFGPDGIHANGTPFNSFGCSRDSLDAEGNPCNSFGSDYDFLDPTSPTYVDISGNGVGGSGSTPLGTVEFLEENKDHILQCILDASIAHKAELSTQVADQRIVCESAMEDLETKIGAASINNPELILGPEGEYFVEGMSNNFLSPIDSGLVERLGINRNSEIVETEYSHARLYQCDEALYDYLELENLGTELLEVGELGAASPSGVVNLSYDTDYENYVKAIFSRLLPHEIKDQMNLIDTLVLCDSVLSWTRSYILHSYEISQTSSIESDREINSVDALADLRSKEPFWTSAVTSASGMSPKDFGADLLEELSYGYQQGWQTVAGYHREELMLAIVKAKSMSVVNNTCETEQLPVSITHGVSSFGFEMIIDNVRFPRATSAYSRADIYYIFEATQALPPLYFRAKDIEFNDRGFRNGEIVLELLVDINRDLPIANVARLEFSSASVTMQCLNVVNVEIEGELEFCRSIAIPLDSDGVPIDGDETVTATVSGSFDSWDDFTATAEVNSTFAIAARPDVHVAVGQFLLDRSSLTTPAVVSFPQGYENPIIQSQGRSAWRGFYADEFSVSIPAKFTEEEGQRTTFTASNLLIDKTGLSVVASVTSGSGNSLIPLSAGSLGGWAASLDSVGVEVLHNRFRRLGIRGLIHVPIGRATAANLGNTPVAEDCLDYTAEMSSNGDFSAYVSVGDPLESDLLGGTITFNRGSSIKLIVGKSFENNSVSAKLSGSFVAGSGTSSNNESDRLSLGSVHFENFHIQTPTGGRDVIPNVGQWRFESDLVNPVPVKFGPFALSLSTPGIYQDPENNEIVGISFVGGVEVTDDFSAQGSFLLKGILESGGNFSDLKYHSFGADGLALNTNMWGTEVDLQLAWSADEQPIWGRAFYGRGTAVFQKKITVSAAAQFGLVNNGSVEDKYFFVDLMATGLKAQLFPGFNITGIGGGLRRGVINENLGGIDPFDAPPDIGSLPPAGPALFGKGLLNAYYTPDPSAGLGLNLITVGETEKEGIANAYAKLGMDFEGNSLKKIYLDGYMKMMTNAFEVSIPLDVGGLKIPPQFADVIPPSIDFGGDAMLTAQFNATLSFNGRTTFNATLDAFLDGPEVHGAGPENSLVRGEAFFGPGKWYIKMGGTQVGQRAGIIMDAAPIASLSSESYFQAGNGIDPIPPLPPRIKSFFGTSDLAQIPNRGNGTGVAFGAHTSLDAYIPAGIFWASLSLATGFDVNLQKYTGVSCRNTGSDIGINGYYAQGQLYAYAAGEAGLEIRNKRVSVLNVEAGILFQASLPNPFYAKGLFKGRIKVGPFGGNATFNIELGEQCDLIVDHGAQASSAADPSFDYILMPSISSGSQLELETPLGYELRFEDHQELKYSVTQGAQQVEHSYTIRVDEMSAFQIVNGQREPVHFGATSPKLVNPRQISIEPSDWWPGNDTLYVELKFSTFKDGDTSDVVHDSTYLFTYPTNDFPTVIARKNILYAYPMQAQREFLPSMYPSHYIGLERSQAYLFSGGGRVFGVYTDIDNNILHITANVDYNLPTNEIISTPSSDFYTDTTWYHFYLVHNKPSEVVSSGNAIQYSVPQVNFGEGSHTSIERLGPNTSPGVPSGLRIGQPLKLDEDEYRSIYSVGFRTSQFNTLEEKVTALSANSNALIYSEVDGFRVETEDVEFDRYESALDGYFVNPNALVHMKLDLTYHEGGVKPGPLWEANIASIQEYYRAKSDLIICEDVDETELQFNLAVAGTPFGADSVTISNATQLELTNRLPSALSLVQDLRNEASGNYGSELIAQNEFQGGAGGERASVGTPPPPDESTLTESNFLVYTFPAVVEYAVDNWFDFITEVEDQALDEMMEIGCFSDINDTEQENYISNRIEFRNSFSALNPYWNSLRNRRGQAARAPLPGAIKFRDYYTSGQSPSKLAVTFQYRLPGPSKSSPVSESIITKLFTIETR